MLGVAGTLTDRACGSSGSTRASMVGTVTTIRFGLAGTVAVNAAGAVGMSKIGATSVNSGASVIVNAETEPRLMSAGASGRFIVRSVGSAGAVGDTYGLTALE